jgi:hypothetical protein
MEEITPAQAYGLQAAQDIETIATKLEAAAANVRRYKPSLERGAGETSAIAADVVNDLTQRVGNLGAFYWNLLHDAHRSDREYLQAETAKKSEG